MTPSSKICQCRRWRHPAIRRWLALSAEGGSASGGIFCLMPHKLVRRKTIKT